MNAVLFQQELFSIERYGRLRPEWEDKHCTVWQWPLEGQSYTIGANPSGGIGPDDSVLWVNQIGKDGGPDVLVCRWVSKQVFLNSFADVINCIGRFYNNALVAVEYNTYQTTGDDLVYRLHYPNLYRWMRKDDIDPAPAKKFHWWTKSTSKNSFMAVAGQWQERGMWKTPVPINIDNPYDSSMKAAMIALYVAHEIPVNARHEEPSNVAQEATS